MGCIFGREEKALSKEDFEFLKNNTRCNKATIEEYYKGFTKGCPTGLITKCEFLKMYQMLFPGGQPDMFNELLFTSLERRGIKALEFKDFLVIIDIINGGTAEEKLKWVFEQYDASGQGVLTYGQIPKIMQFIYSIINVNGGNITQPIETKVECIFGNIKSKLLKSFTMEEFINGCVEDDELFQNLAPSVMCACF